MLAYLFWHRPQTGVEADAYEDAQRAFHATLDVRSACFRLDELPFHPSDGYEDWYLVDSWRALGELNNAATAARRRVEHDLLASLSGPGWGAVYELVRGDEGIPAEASWFDKPRDKPLERVLESLPEEPAVWQRRLVLGPAPELCLAAGGPERTAICP